MNQIGAGAASLPAIERPSLWSVVHESWHPALEPLRDRINAIDAELERRERAGEQILPSREHIMRAFESDVHATRVMIVGQDPYPTPGHPIGLAFAVARDVRPLPRSLQNIYRELRDDLGVGPAEHGDLSSWVREGVLLLNRTLTVRAGSPDSHAKLGWGEVTEAAVHWIDTNVGATVAIAWGAKARSLGKALRNTTVIGSAHPSPLSASRGFFGSRPFSRANEALIDAGRRAIDWTVR